MARLRRGAHVVGVAAGLLVAWSGPAGAVTVSDEMTFRAAWSNAAETQIDLAADITLTCAGGGTAQRNGATALTLDGHGHSITQTCANSNAIVVLSNAFGVSMVMLRNVTITHGKATGSLTLTNSTVNATTDSNNVSESVTVEVRKRHQPRPHQPRPHQPPAPAALVQAVVRFTG